MADSTEMTYDKSVSQRVDESYVYRSVQCRASSNATIPGQSYDPSKGIALQGNAESGQ